MTTSARPTLNLEPGTLNSRSWKPSPDDHLIYQWVKFEGYTQTEVASMLRISQPTVCRVIQRYERWQAHLKDREGGRLDAQERLRAQRWLTYERNELILASCFRIAEEMERSTELSKTTIRRPIDQPLKQNELRTEQRVVDRHGVASRFLRLAFRVNMEQLKLTDLIAREGDTPAEPLTDEELAAELHQAALDAAELAAGRSGADIPVCHDGETERTRDGEMPLDLPSVAPSLEPPFSAPSPQPPVPAAQPPAPPPMYAVNNLNNSCILEIPTTPDAPCTCILQPSAEKNSSACIIDCDQPDWPLETQARSASAGTGGQLGSLHREPDPAVA